MYRPASLSPRKLVGLVDALQSPSYSTAVGLLYWAMSGYNAFRPKESGNINPRREWGRRLGGWLKVFLPDS